MATKYDMPTNEGCLALARAVSAGSKLVIREAKLYEYSGTGMDSVDSVAGLTYSFLNARALETGTMSCTSYLPIAVDTQGTETGYPRMALDLEFTCMPSEEIRYNVIAVLADMYYAIGTFVMGLSYNVGTIVKYTSSSTTEYYKCIESITVSDTAPINDPIHWERVDIINTLDGAYGDITYATISVDPVLLYVSKTLGTITVGSQLELDYKVRLYLENVQNTSKIDEFIIFNTLGPEFMSSAQLDILASFSEQLNRMREVALAAVAKQP